MLTRIEEFKKFRYTLYSFFSKRADAVMNLLDAVSSFGHQARSVVELSEAPCFKRKYSSITDAIADGLPHVKWDNVQRYLFQTLFNASANQPPCFLVDCTPNPRPFANTLKDRSITHSPNPAPGNKPICIGHSYSCVALLPTDPLVHDKKWLIPLSMQRVASDQKGNEVGMKQVASHIQQLNLENQLTVSIGDSLYGSEACRIITAEHENLVHIFRLKNNRKIYAQPHGSDQSKKHGRKKEYGDVMSLSDATTHPTPTQRAETGWRSRNGKLYRVKIDAWENRLLRGSRQYHAASHPMTLIRICIVDDEENSLFKRPLWLAVLGKTRKDLSLVSICQYYRSRYNLEHFFRFGKTKLLLDRYQTPSLIHEEHWWKLCLIAYAQLYMVKSLVPQLPKSWEKYLPEYRDIQKKTYLHQHSSANSTWLCKTS